MSKTTDKFKQYTSFWTFKPVDTWGSLSGSSFWEPILSGTVFSFEIHSLTESDRAVDTKFSFVDTIESDKIKFDDPNFAPNFDTTEFDWNYFSEDMEWNNIDNF
jgi:hypothetical protein